MTMATMRLMKKFATAYFPFTSRLASLAAAAGNGGGDLTPGLAF